MSNACALGKETRVVGRVDGGDVAKWASVACTDVDRFRSGGGGAGGRRWDLTSGFLDQTGDGDAVVGKSVVCIGGVIPF